MKAVLVLLAVASLGTGPARGDDAPSSPLDLKSETGNAWKAANAFAVRWQDPNPGDGSPVVSALARMCPVGDKDQRRCVVAEQKRSHGKGTTTFNVPGPGDWNARIWLRDAASNATEANGVVLEHLRFDPTPPIASSVRSYGKSFISWAKP